MGHFTTKTLHGEAAWRSYRAIGPQLSFEAYLALVGASTLGASYWVTPRLMTAATSALSLAMAAMAWWHVRRVRTKQVPEQTCFVRDDGILLFSEDGSTFYGWDAIVGRSSVRDAVVLTIGKALYLSLPTTGDEGARLRDWLANEVPSAPPPTFGQKLLRLAALYVIALAAMTR